MYFGTMTVFEIYISYRFAIKHLANFQCLTEVLQILVPAFRSRYFGLAMQLTVRRNAVASNTVPGSSSMSLSICLRKSMRLSDAV